MPVGVPAVVHYTQVPVVCTSTPTMIMLDTIYTDYIVKIPSLSYNVGGVIV